MRRTAFTLKILATLALSAAVGACSGTSTQDIRPEPLAHSETPATPARTTATEAHDPTATPTTPGPTTPPTPRDERFSVLTMPEGEVTVPNLRRRRRQDSVTRTSEEYETEPLEVRWEDVDHPDPATASAIATWIAALAHAGVEANTFGARCRVVLANERIKVQIPFGELPCTYTLSLYIQRDAINDNESVEVAKVKDERDGAKAKRESDETERLAREKRAAFQLGQESTMTALKNIGELAAGVNAITRLQAGK